MKIFWYFFIFVFILIPCSSEGQQISRTTLFTSNEGGYTIQFPSDWEVEKGYFGVDSMAFSPQKEAHSSFRENINVAFVPIGVTLEREALLQLTIQRLRLLLKDFHLEGSSPAVFNQGIGHWLSYSHTVGTLEVKVLQYFVLTEHKLFIITCTATPETYRHYLAIFQQVATSFQIRSSFR